YLAAFPSPAGAAARTAGTSAVAAARPVTYHGTRGTGVRVATSARGAAGASLPVVRSASAERRRHLPFRTPSGSSRSARGHRARAPRASADTLLGAGAASGKARPGAAVVHAFNGLSNLRSVQLNGFSTTPPDQGLCAGHDASLPGSPAAIW